MDMQMPLKPRISEKTYMLSETRNVYVVDVPLKANRDTVAKAVAAQFGVTVDAVNMIVVKGKSTRTVRKGGRAIAGKRSDYKKAYVTLKEGDSLPFFAEAEAPAEAKEDKKADKKAKKEEK
jgi:large subunit ribosomal protein L23